MSKEGSGRKELALWLTRPDHPLTARVMVNRIWRWHFGRGLVETADNFGLLGSKPSHPELLDHLAVELARDWSLKQLHRRIMLSATYQTSSRATPSLAQADPENRLLGRMSMHRLEAEAIRDAMLAVSGSLDRRFGGRAIETENRKFIFNHTSKDATTYSSRRRSVYLPVVRNHLYEGFTLFDYADASVSNGNRDTSTVASQALYLLNSAFTLEMAQRLAQRISDLEVDNDDHRVNTLYTIAYGRSPSLDENDRAKAFLDDVGSRSSRAQAWQMLCHNVLISSEFIYLR